MFTLLITSNPTAWETDQLMRMFVERFKEYSGIESAAITLDNPQSLKTLEKYPALLMYEKNSGALNGELVRYGYVRDIKVAHGEITFRFNMEGQFSRAIIEEFADRLGVGQNEFTRTHWAIKDGDIPSTMLQELVPYYDVVFSFAGENRGYVEKVTKYLKSNGVRVFYDRDEEANLWGKNLAEHFDWIYRRSGKYCVPFVSSYYVKKEWTRHERRSALARALRERKEYILPARFDDTEVDGMSPDVAFADLRHKTPEEFGALILQKLGKTAKHDAQE